MADEEKKESAQAAAPEDDTIEVGGQETTDPAKEKKTRKKTEKKDTSKQKLADLEEKLTAAAGEAAELKDRLLRKAAEFDNYRKRTEKEKTAASGNGIAAAVEKFLPVLDNLERAAEAETADEAYKKGVLMTVIQFRNALDILGVKEIEAQGLPFDPNYHTAIAQVPSESESGTVVSVMQKGYMLGDRVIRPSMVSVAE